MKHSTHFLRLLLIGIGLICCTNDAWCQSWNPSFSVGTTTGKYSFSYTQTPDPLVEIFPAGIPNTSLTYQWEQSIYPTTGFSNISGATSSSYTFSGVLTQTTYFRKKVTSGTLGSMYSNVVKISVVSANWEDLNYIREHDVLRTGITDWITIDTMSIGTKLQTTSYLDGLGRAIEKVSRETATPSSGSLWGDKIQFAQYDALGREPLKYLPYTDTAQIGKYKTAPLTNQPAYYSSVYSETNAYSNISFDKSPLNRITNVKEPGASWAASSGKSAGYDVNTVSDSVQMFSVSYVQWSAPANNGAYAAGTLYKLTYTDENSKQVIEYTDKSGRLILKKVQIDDSPSSGHPGWICTYSVYDDYGLLRFQLQPEAVKYLDMNSWSFSGTDGATVLKELCFQYNYDDKGRTIWKKAPGAGSLNMIYDIRDRIVFMQDSVQRVLSTPQWTANLYDVLDRPIITTLYNTSSSVSTLQSSVNSATTVVCTTITNTGSPIVDLLVDTRVPGDTSYRARNTIVFAADAGGSFTSEDSAEFVARIVDTAATAPTTTTVTTFSNPIDATSLKDTSICKILKYFFYDNYSFTNVKSFNSSSTNTSAYSTSDANVIPIAASQRTTSMPTGSMVRVLRTNMFLSSSEYYDEKGRHIQTLEDNIRNGTDITTLQYHFDGRLLSTCSSHSTPYTGYSNFITLTKYLFDKLGRVVSIQKQYGSNSLATVATYDYDDIGRVKTKHLDPNFTGGDLESLNYSFNIHNQITGINKDYALKASGYSKWSHFFGMYLGYNNGDAVFAAAQLNGQVTGQLWNTLGDDAQRKYDYAYDNAGRLINANYNEQQHPGDGWGHSTMDFSVSGTSGHITYDLNGNLLTMLQKGVLPGSSSPLTIDDLRYSYASYSNKLDHVTDQMTDTSRNGRFGDFKDGSNSSGTPDYVYDGNGNLVVDLNKNVQSLNGGSAGTPGISYNFLDKPEQINIVGKGVIKIVYSADGEKLQRTFTPTSGTAITTTYINQFVYQANGSGVDSLKFINFEEGRIRVMQAVSIGNGYDALIADGNINLPNSQRGAFDYFVMDYQHNVRMILTEEKHQSSSQCTMETSRATIEDAVFQGDGSEVEATRVSKPSAWVNTGYNLGSSVSKLGNTSGHNLGPNTLQKVMAGDTVNTTVQYYYASTASGTNSSFASTVINNLLWLLNGSGNVSTLVKGNATAIGSQLGSNTGFVNVVQSSSTTGSTPLAYLRVLFFDERFNFISSSDGGVAQAQVASSVTTTGDQLALSIRAPKNGYVYVYVSNQSNQDVFFDNLNVGINAGNILEENHYYAFGLKIAGISSKKLADQTGDEGHTKNEYGYNDKELFDDGDLNWVDYGFRNYDPQIGRFLQIDPLSDDYDALTPYHYAANDPVGNSDEDGLGVISDVGMVACAGTNSSFVMGMISTLASLGQTTVGKVFTLINIAGNTTKIVNNATSNSKVNGQLKTEGVGHKSLDGQKGVSQADFEKRGRESASFEFEKLIGRSWHSAGGNKQVNDITGQVRYTRTALGDDLVGQAFGFYAMGKIPMPKFGLMAKIEGWLGIEATESLIPWEKISGIIRAALKGKGNFGLGSATYEEAMAAGKSWVGDGYRISSDGKAWVSSDELRIFRPPTYKPKLKMTQANFEWKTKVGGQPQGNGHLDIFKP